MFLRAVSVLLIKVLMDLKNLRVAFFYRHLGPSGPKTGTPLPPEPLRRAQTALILEILEILLQTTEKRATGIKPMARFDCYEQQPKSPPSSGLEALHVYRICRESVPSVGQDRLILTRLRSGDRKLQSIARRSARDAFAARAAAPHPNRAHPENPDNPGNPASDNKHAEMPLQNGLRCAAT